MRWVLKASPLGLFFLSVVWQVFWFQAIWVLEVEFPEEFLAPIAVFYRLLEVFRVIISLPFQKVYKLPVNYATV